MKNSQQHSILETLEQRAMFTVTPDPGSTLATALNLGNLVDTTVHDFVGQTDPVDIYKFNLPAKNQFTATLSLDNNNPSIKAHISVIHDFNGNGQVDRGDTEIETAPGTSGKDIINLTPGTFFVRVTGDQGSSTYHLRLTADYAFPGEPRATGSLDKIKTFNDFISNPDDMFDDYTFSVTNTRPFFAAISESGGGKPVLALYTDPNNDGKPDQLLTSIGGDGFAKFLRTIDAGHYVLRVQALSGSGTYQLAAEARPDVAGNTLKTAKNLGAINGLAHLDDYVDGSDPFDFYKFTTASSGTIGASIFCDFANADLSLIRDANNNGIVDKGDVVATGQITPMSQTKEFTAKISAGSYFLRAAFNDLEGLTSKYFVSFQTDYAGATPKSARNVGSLFGTKTFDDWASGPFSGAISDTADVYKFSLSSTRAFSAKLVGVLSGQDLDLQLYRDKNNDGVLSSNELIASSHHLNSPNEQISKSLGAGTYYVKVVGLNGETNYHLSLKA